MTASQAGERLDRHALKAPFVSVEVGFYGFISTQSVRARPVEPEGQMEQ